MRADQSKRPPPSRLYADRAAGGDRHHRRAGVAHRRHRLPPDRHAAGQQHQVRAEPAGDGIAEGVPRGRGQVPHRADPAVKQPLGNVYYTIVLPMADGDPNTARVIWVKLRLKQTFPNNFFEALNPAPMPPLGLYQNHSRCWATRRPTPQPATVGVVGLSAPGAGPRGGRRRRQARNPRSQQLRPRVTLRRTAGPVRAWWTAGASRSPSAAGRASAPS